MITRIRRAGRNASRKNRRRELCRPAFCLSCRINITATYYINQSDKAAAVTIQAEVDKAVQDYIAWQTTEIGRDKAPKEMGASRRHDTDQEIALCLSPKNDWR